MVSIPAVLALVALQEYEVNNERYLDYLAGLEFISSNRMHRPLASADGQPRGTCTGSCSTAHFQAQSSFGLVQIDGYEAFLLQN